MPNESQPAQPNDPNLGPPSAQQPLSAGQPRQPSGQHVQARLPSGQHAQPRVPTGQQQRLPTGSQQRVPTGQYRSPTGQFRPPTGQYRPASGVHSLHDAPYFPAKKKSDYSLYAILGIVLVAVGVIYIVARDHWEADNKAFLLELKHDADSVRNTQKQIALSKYDKLIKTVGARTLADPELTYAYKESKRQREQIQIELADADYAAMRQADGKTDVKANDEYAKYAAKAQPLLDALQRVKVDADAKTDMARYEDDFKEVAVQYDRWERSLEGDEARYHSARLFTVARDSYKTGFSWWAIKTAKKMPDALYADYMRDQEWSRADYVLKKIKVCMDAKEAVERKTCNPCEGTGRIKCPVCLGTGTCAYCKGKGNPDLNCCTNGVCDACKGRKDSQCAICNGQGVFPPK